MAVNSTLTPPIRNDICANPGCCGQDCSYQGLYELIYDIDVSDPKALSDVLASLFAPALNKQVTSKTEVSKLTYAWYSANSAIFRDNPQCVKEFMLAWICDKYDTCTSVEPLKTLLDKLPGLFANLLPDDIVTAWTVKKALQEAMKMDASVAESLIASAAELVRLSDVDFLYDIGKC
ncbi:1826_t:CDS:2 [Paraglomus occultum]|uniref:1826_t:CDS:1 n=1 Tax=Paraglomus occultum TaxID=144539 RepID=A0A9N8ZUL6_9GLOM|nr:1826_t:CDS:2 [Paraglomus occultum]